jgi:hypothetical protein
MPGTPVAVRAPSELVLYIAQRATVVAIPNAWDELTKYSKPPLAR